jgi:hypothetical protein
LVELEDPRVALFDDDRSTRDGGQRGELELQLAGRQRRDEIGQRLALHRGLQQPVDEESVVTGP